ncbi:MAG TPA: glycosyltransferase family 1 protein [Pedobacter sp.]|jgi:glycosyltransferase involved in cell wall biosynthesis
MNIGFDGKRAANNLTGLGNYSRSLIGQLAQFFPQNQYFVYTPKIKDRPQIKAFFNLQNVRFVLPSSSFNFLWRTLRIKKQLSSNKIDLYHGLSHEIPLGLKQIGVPSIVTIHDLIFLKFPHYFGRIDRFIYTLKSRYACVNADKIVAISEQTKKDIISFFDIDEDKIEVVYQSCDDSFKTPVSNAFKQQVKDKLSLPAQYILTVGTIEARKNLVTLIKALANVSADYKLVVVGKETAYKQLVLNEIENLSLKDRVIFLKDVPFNELPAIYQMASVFIYPSFYEGFGIPIIEALYAQVPVIAATGSCLEEAGGTGSLYINPEDPKDLAATITRVLNDGQLQNEMKQKGLSYVQRFNSDKIASDMMTVYQKVYENGLNTYQK